MDDQKIAFRACVSGATFIVVGKEAAERIEALACWKRLPQK